MAGTSPRWPWADRYSQQPRGYWKLYLRFGCTAVGRTGINGEHFEPAGYAGAISDLEHRCLLTLGAVPEEEFSHACVIASLVDVRLLCCGQPGAGRAHRRPGSGYCRGGGSGDRSNVGKTHSPEVLNQLADPARMTPMTGPGQLAPGVTASVAMPGDEQGIDVASFQHPNGAAINWSQVAASGIDFAAVKVTEGDYYRNPYALTDLAQAQAAGLAVAAYAFAIPNGNGSSSNPVTQADYLLNDLGAQSRSVPIMLDIEYNPYGAECYGLTSTAMVTWISKFDTRSRPRPVGFRSSTPRRPGGRRAPAAASRSPPPAVGA